MCSQESENLIPGINYNEALARFGSEAMYLNIVRSFVKNTPHLLEKSRKITGETLADYAIIVHGIKGTSRAIGAHELGSMAEELEYAAKQGRLDFCLTGNRAFRKKAEMLIAALGAFVKEHAPAFAKPEKDAPDDALLLKLKNAAACYDIIEIDNLIAELEAYNYRNNNELVEKLRAYIDNSDFKALTRC
ncbi:MAG: Hpt domain-containing protein [Spirochaetaceae bacterium]|nr:Hpt domain-containing protein [Spirochaetaceae bacterium]